MLPSSPRRRERLSSVMPDEKLVEKPASTDGGHAERFEAGRGERDLHRGGRRRVERGRRSRSAPIAATLAPPRHSSRAPAHTSLPSSGRSRSGRCPARRRSRRPRASQQRHPFARFRVAQRRGLQSLAGCGRSAPDPPRSDPGYALYQTCVGSWWRRRYSLNFRSSPHPSRMSQFGPRISDAVAEHDVEPEADLVDEIVHVALEAAVVVAAEHARAAGCRGTPSGRNESCGRGPGAPRVKTCRAT